MHFIVIARDGDDENALSRRMEARNDHISVLKQGIKQGKNVIAAAMLNNNGEMNGSVMIVDYPNIEAVEKWLNDEPYVVQNVWKDIQIIPCKVPDLFLTQE